MDRDFLTRGAPRVMGIVNVTPDSFSDGGCFFSVDRAVAHGLGLVEAGADILDVGGESTRPGAPSVALDEELERVVPVVQALSERCDVPISIDTRKPEVMRAAVEAGASMINDVGALGAPGALEAAVALGVPVCLMHMQGEPRDMQKAPHYADVVAEVRAFLHERAMRCTEAGLLPSQIILDPGFGFGKTLAHNLALLAALGEIVALGYPVLVGMSRKRMLGEITGREVGEREAAGLAAHLLALERGARILRVHDVKQTVDMVRVHTRVMEYSTR
ncbi:MAG: dihydropteroate synthase [Halothiobacillaceae bacterium]|jgi:dihydropteroate synthase|nr:dihydropteroate synthase [Halothiobacillaceae bacterium]MDY0050468.1 dihydropteroate synthase [Halothiobacillaceae bacterium]